MKSRVKVSSKAAYQILVDMDFAETELHKDPRVSEVAINQPLGKRAPPLT